MTPRERCENIQRTRRACRAALGISPHPVSQSSAPSLQQHRVLLAQQESGAAEDRDVERPLSCGLHCISGRCPLSPHGSLPSVSNTTWLKSHELKHQPVPTPKTTSSLSIVLFYFHFHQRTFTFFSSSLAYLSSVFPHHLYLQSLLY